MTTAQWVGLALAAPFVLGFVVVMLLTLYAIVSEAIDGDTDAREAVIIAVVVIGCVGLFVLAMATQHKRQSLKVPQSEVQRAE